MNADVFDTFDFLINDEDEVMLLLYEREGEPKNPRIELNAEENAALLVRNETDSLLLKDISADVFDSLQDARYADGLRTEPHRERKGNRNRPRL